METSVGLTVTNATLNFDPIHLSPFQTHSFCALPSAHSLHLDNYVGANSSVHDNQLDQYIKLLSSLEAGKSASGPPVGAWMNASESNRHSSKELRDPYIDAVHVDSRVDNRRGKRVKAASKLLKKKESFGYLAKGKDEFGDYESDDDFCSDDHDDDLGDSDDEHEHPKLKHHKLKHHEKDYNKGYNKGYQQKRRGKMGHRGRYHAAKVTVGFRSSKGGLGAGPGKGLKFAYIYHRGPLRFGKGNKWAHGGGGGGGGHAYGKGHHGKHGHSKGHRKYGGKGPAQKFHVAGILGYTLFCVNYLMLVQQLPAGHGYGAGHSHSGSHYGPRNAHKAHRAKGHPHPYQGFHAFGKQSRAKYSMGGPLILAHCGEMPAASLHPAKHGHCGAHKSHCSPGAGLSFMGSQVSRAGEPLELRPAASSNSSQQVAAARSQPLSTSESRLAPISRRRLVFDADPDEDPEGEPAAAAGRDDAPFRLVVRRPRPLTVPSLAGARLELERRGAGQRRGLLLTVARRPELVSSRDNLAQLRHRSVPVRLRVAARGAQAAGAGPEPRPVSLNLELVARELSARLGPLQVSVRRPAAPLGLQPSASAGLARANESAQAEAGARQRKLQQLVELPEFAMTGDSIELSCAHQMPTERLHSVRWFKDSLEFYRFVPADEAQQKSWLPLPDVQLDPERSNGDTVYLRNVTHRSSGLFRCEAIAEEPNSETLIGQKRMLVYSLPSSGPRISLLEEPASRQTALTLRPNRLRVQLEREESPDSGAGPSAEGPITFRCWSAPASPAAQLAVSVNNEPLASARVLENSTLSYSDGLEVSVVSFRLRLEDFLFNGGPAASLKGAATEPAAGNSSRPPLELAAAKQRADNSSSNGLGANSQVQFDDQVALHKASPSTLGSAVGLPQQKVSAQAARKRRQIEQQSLYSNYIRIKCFSLLPAIKYEMVSELNAPLTLLVPAAHLTEALQSSTANNRSATASDQADRPRSRTQSSARLPNDRLAQGSAPPAKVLPAPSSTNRTALAGSGLQASSKSPAPARGQQGGRAKQLQKITQTTKQVVPDTAAKNSAFKSLTKSARSWSTITLALLVAALLSKQSILSAS